MRDDAGSELRQELADLRAALYHEFAVFIWRFAGMLIVQAALIIVAIKLICEARTKSEHADWRAS